MVELVIAGGVVGTAMLLLGINKWNIVYMLVSVVILMASLAGTVWI